jgi:DNA-directed RNA polymerase subunit RPC12/RpoP
MGIKSSVQGFGAKLFGINKGMTETTVRPSIAQPYMSTDTGAKLPIFPFPLIMIYELADNIDALRIPIETLNREMFKNGFEIVEKWKYKCNNCGKEFQYAPIAGDNPDDQPFETNQDNKENAIPKQKASEQLAVQNMQCDTCGNTNLLRPKPQNRKVLEDLLNNPINGNNQSIEDVSRQLERDLEIADNAYLLLLKNYFIDERTKQIIPEKSEIKEMLRIDPPQVAMIADSDGRIGYDDKRNKIFVCPRFEHRDRRLTVDTCDRCGTKALKAVCEVNSVYSIGIPQPKRVVYGEGEVIWKAGKYKPSLIYGFSPIYSVWSKAMALSHMDEYIRKYFDKMRPPRGMLVIASRNYETFRKSWDALEQKAQEDPYMIHPLLVESDKGGKNMAQWLDFTGSLKELEFTEIRRELRMIIGAIYGVLPLYFGELPSGWSQEGLQVTITNRAIKWGQDVLAKGFFNKIAKVLDVDDWELKLKVGEETDKLRDLQTQGVEIGNMAQMQGMGFDITRTHTGEFKVSKDTAFSAADMIGMGEQQRSGRGKQQGGTKEQRSDMQGQPAKTRPSDVGGVGQGSPTSGSSISQKALPPIHKKFPDGINPANYEVIKSTLQTAVDFQWSKTRTVDELRSKAGMTVRQARELVKNELGQTRRWEDVQKKEVDNSVQKEEEDDE